MNVTFLLSFLEIIFPFVTYHRGHTQTLLFPQASKGIFIGRSASPGWQPGSFRTEGLCLRICLNCTAKTLVPEANLKARDSLRWVLRLSLFFLLSASSPSHFTHGSLMAFPGQSSPIIPVAQVVELTINTCGAECYDQAACWGSTQSVDGHGERGRESSSEVVGATSQTALMFYTLRRHLKMADRTVFSYTSTVSLPRPGCSQARSVGSTLLTPVLHSSLTQLLF